MSADFRLSIADCRLKIADFRLPHLWVIAADTPEIIRILWQRWR